MKARQLLDNATCSLCGKPVLHTQVPLFWVVSIVRFGVDVQAMRRFDGLSALVGGSKIAEAMGPDEDIAKPMYDPVTLTICETCGTSKNFPIAAYAEINLENLPSED